MVKTRKAARRTVAKPPAANKTAELLELRPNELTPHPKNPRRNFDPDELAKLTASVARHGVLQSVIARRHAGGFQLLGGERRVRAAKAARVATVPARVIEADDREALEILMLENLDRVDLNPIEKARGLAELCRPVVEGGAGLTQAEAAARFGNGQAWCADLVALLELPEWIQRGVITGDIPRTAAREVVPYVGLPAITAAVEAAWKRGKKNGGYGWPWDRRQWGSEVSRAVREATRPIETADKPFYDYQVRDGAFGRLFRLTKPVEAELEIVELPIGPRGQRWRRATNCKRFDKLQQAAAAEAKAKRRAARGSGVRGKPAGTAGPVDSEAAAASEQTARRAAADKLKSRAATWCTDFARILAAAELDRRISNLESELWPGEAVVLHVAQLDAGAVRAAAEFVGEAYGDEIAETAGRSPGSAVELRAARIGQALLDSEGGTWGGWHTGWHTGWRAAAGESERYLAGILAALNIDIRAAWAVACRGANPGREHVRRFLELHNREQLEALGREWKIAATGKTKAQQIKTLLGDVERPVPKMLRKLFDKVAGVDWQTVLDLAGAL